MNTLSIYGRDKLWYFKNISSRSDFCKQIISSFICSFVGSFVDHFASMKTKANINGRIKRSSSNTKCKKKKHHKIKSKKVFDLKGVMMFAGKLWTLLGINKWSITLKITIIIFQFNENVLFVILQQYIKTRLHSQQHNITSLMIIC